MGGKLVDLFWSGLTLNSELTLKTKSWQKESNNYILSELNSSALTEIILQFKHIHLNVINQSLPPLALSLQVTFSSQLLPAAPTAKKSNFFANS